MFPKPGGCTQRKRRRWEGRVDIVPQTRRSAVTLFSLLSRKSVLKFVQVGVIFLRVTVVYGRAPQAGSCRKMRRAIIGGRWKYFWRRTFLTAGAGSLSEGTTVPDINHCIVGTLFLCFPSYGMFRCEPRRSGCAFLFSQSQFFG